MWILRPYIAPKPLRIDLPRDLVEGLGFGADVLAAYLEDISNSMISDVNALAAPPCELCRICDRQISTWWFERHCDLCVLEHKAESDLQLAHESLLEQRNTIASILASFESRSTMVDSPVSPPAFAAAAFSDTNSLTTSVSSTAANPHSPTISYRGFLLPLPSFSSLDNTPSQNINIPLPGSPPKSPRQLAAPPTLHPKRSMNKLQALSKKSPIRLVELLLELCDMALQINTPEIKRLEPKDSEDDTDEDEKEFQVHSPHSETRIHQVKGWSSSSVDDAGLSVLCADTEEFVRNKVDAAIRLGNTLIYSEKIRLEIKNGVQSVIEETIDKVLKHQQDDYVDDDTYADEDSEIFKDDEDEVVEEEFGHEDFTNHKLKEQKSMSSENSLFSRSYLQGDELPQQKTSAITQSSNLSQSPSNTLPSAVKAIPYPINTQIGRGNTVSPTQLTNDLKNRSVTPKSLLSETSSSSSNNNFNTSVTPSSMSPVITEQPSSKERKSLSRLRISDDNKDDSSYFDLSNYPRIRPRRSTSNLPLGSPRNTISSNYGSPLSSIQRNRVHASSVVSSDNMSPGASPLLFPHDYEARYHYRHASVASDFNRNPVSPLLNASVPKHGQPSIKDYEIISPISKGAFGSVYLSRKKLTGEYFAIKVLKKADMIAKNQVMNVKAERAILMAQSDSPFVAKLFCTFQSRDYLFLVMEYLNGGDCAALIKALGGISELWAQSYMAEVVVGVDDLHQKGIVHRDLKPDNLLIDNKGHLKLTDFGLSRMGLIKRHTRLRTGPVMSGSLSSSFTTESSDIAMKRTASLGDGRSSISSVNNGLLHDPNISYVPGYFNLSKPTSTSAVFERPLSSIRSDYSSSGSENNLQSIVSHPLDIKKSKREDDNSGNVSNDQQQLLLSQSPFSTSSGSQTILNQPVPMTLFDLNNDSTRKFVGTPDYLAPETIRGTGQDETSDWWSLGCILFEFLFGYPPFHDDSPEKVFKNVLERNIQWPPESEKVASAEARELIDKLLCMDQNERLGAKGAEEIRTHPFFNGITNWESLWDGPASFVPSIEHPESTDYFDSRGAVMQEFPEDSVHDVSVENQSPTRASLDYYQSDSSDNASSSRPSTGSPSNNQSNNHHHRHDKKDRLKFMPLHIPPHVRDGRVRRLSEPAVNDDFGSFSFKNLPVLERANKELIYKLKTENLDHRTSNDIRSRGLSISTVGLKRGGSPNSSSSNSTSPRHMSLSGSLVVSPLQTSSQIKASKSSSSDDPTLQLLAPVPNRRPQRSIVSGSPDSINFNNIRRTSSARRLSNMGSSPELRDEFRRQSAAQKYSQQVFDMDPTNSDTEESRGAALLRVQKRRQVSRQKQLPLEPEFRTLDILVCDINPVWRYSTEKMLVRMGCRVVSVSTGPEAIRRATGDVKFDVIILEYRLPKTSGADVARLIHNTVNPNTDTPIIAMTSFVKDANDATNMLSGPVFAGVIEKPPTHEKIVHQLKSVCLWMPKEEEKKGENERLI